MTTVFMATSLSMAFHVFVGVSRNGAPCRIVSRCTIVAEERTPVGYHGQYISSCFAEASFKLMGKMAKLRRRGEFD